MTSTEFLNPLILIPFVGTLALITWLIPAKYRWGLFLLVSYIFYFLIGKWAISILAVSTLVNYCLGRLLAAKKPGQRPLLIIGIAFNLVLLIFFKYFARLISPESFLFSFLGSSEGKIVFPVGLSFFTLQNISYLLDTSRGLIPAEKNLGVFAVYTAFFPKIIAGPIERGKKLLPQITLPKTITQDDLTSGSKMILFGLFKKFVIADRLLIFVDEIFTHPGKYHGLILLAAIFFLSFQIYLDFSGYTNIALGIARLLGIELTENFKRPYLSENIVEFWTRWHISFSTWLRDYIFYPTRRFFLKKTKKSVGLLTLVVPSVLTMLISGLWHGSGWTFIVWGLYHAVFYTLVIVKKSKTDVKDSNLSLLKRIAAIAGNFAVTSFGWVFFKADSVHSALVILRSMFAWKINLTLLLESTNHVDFYISLVMIPIVVFSEIYQETHKEQSILARLPYAARWAVYLAMLLLLTLVGIFQNGGNPFVYGLF